MKPETKIHLVWAKKSAAPRISIAYHSIAEAKLGAAALEQGGYKILKIVAKEDGTAATDPN